MYAKIFIPKTNEEFLNDVHHEPQTIDSEFTQQSVSDLLESDGSSDAIIINTERFQNYIAKMTKVDGTKKYP